jgi:catechol 2,3-dioxygenase-like lactoylglutathione lyase family enzyme
MRRGCGAFGRTPFFQDRNPMKIEHIALYVSDPVAVTRWYSDELGLSVVRSGGAPSHTHFLADSAGSTVLEIQTGALPAPDYASLDPTLLHVALATDDVSATRSRLLAAGASAVGEITTLANGDELAMLRDPWGLALQLVRRSRPLIADR